MITETTSPKKATSISQAPPLVRLSAGTLLLAERTTTREMRRDVDDATKRVTGELTQHHYLRDAGIMLLLQSASKRLATDLESTLRAAKERSRAYGARRLQVELRAAGAIEVAKQVPLTAKVVTDIQATTSAEALALAWRQRAIYESLKAQRVDTSVAEALGNIDIDSSVTRTAATESAQAYDEGHTDAATDIDVSGLVDRWESLLDACPRCSALDGMTVPVGETFEGETPGSMHPRCRCLRVTVKV